MLVVVVNVVFFGYIYFWEFLDRDLTRGQAFIDLVINFVHFVVNLINFFAQFIALLLCPSRIVSLWALAFSLEVDSRKMFGRPVGSLRLILVFTGILLGYDSKAIIFSKLGQMNYENGLCWNCFHGLLKVRLDLILQVLHINIYVRKVVVILVVLVEDSW